MTQVHVIQSSSAKLNMEALGRSTKTHMRALVAPHGEFSLGCRPPGQWYIQHLGPGHYRVMHNLNRIDYAVSVSKVMDEPSCIETGNLTPISFEVKISTQGEFVDRPFEFALNFIDSGE